MGMGKLELTEEQRRERSERMRALHAQGKAGPQFGRLGGRPRKKRSSELVAEKAAEDADKIWKKLKELIESDSPKVSLDAIKHVHAIEEQERKTQELDEMKYDQMRREELVERVLENLEMLNEKGVIDLGSLVSGELVEVVEN